MDLVLRLAPVLSFIVFILRHARFVLANILLSNCNAFLSVSLRILPMYSVMYKTLID